tara:strand:- start:1208 stop:2020 length:813 start_codon:yes stop_codon:yes gene_type:complete
MSKGSSPSSITSTQSAEPSDFIRPYLTQAMDYNQDLFESDMPNYFPNATYVGYSPETETSLELARRRAVAGNPLLNQSQTQASSILSGDYLDPTTNPYTQGLFDQMAGDVTSRVNSQFTKAGRFGSGANQEILADSLGDLANTVYGDQYNREREIMANTMGLAPALGDADYNDIQRLGQVGVDKESLEQAKLDDAIKRFDYEQKRPFMKLENYLGNIGANYAQNQVSTNPVTRDRFGGLLSGIGQGVGMASDLGIDPRLAGGIGGLLGYL